MSNGYEAARGQRNALERLAEKIPGYAGFADRELRREVDKLQREHVARGLERLKSRLRDAARAYTDAGKLEVLSRFERLDGRLERLSQGILFGDYGATGLFDAEKIGDAELDTLYRFDLEVTEEAERVAGLAADVPAPGGEDPAPALDALLAAVDALAETWAERDVVMSRVVQR